MSSESNTRDQWAQVAADLQQYRAEQQAAWGDVDNATLGRYVAGEATAAERRRVESALAEHPQLRTLVELVGDVLGDGERAAPAAPAPFEQPRSAVLSFTKHAKQRGRWHGRVRRYAPLGAAAAILLAIGTPGAILVVRGLREPGRSDGQSFALNSPPSERRNKREFMPSVRDASPPLLRSGNPVRGGGQEGKSADLIQLPGGAGDPMPASESVARTAFKMREADLPKLRVAWELLDADGDLSDHEFGFDPAVRKIRPHISHVMAFSNLGARFGDPRALRSGHADRETLSYSTNPYVPSGDPYAGSISGGIGIPVGRHYRSGAVPLVDARRRIISEWQFERMDTTQNSLPSQPSYLPVPQPEPQRQIVSKVLSGAELNDLFDKLVQDKRNLRGRTHVAVAGDLPRRINFVSGAGMCVGLLKDEGQLTWPEALPGIGFGKQRERLDQLTRETVRQVTRDARPASDATVKEMEKSARELRQTLIANINEVAPEQYIEAKRFLNELAKDLPMLRRVDAAKHFATRHSWQPKTVADLVDYMSSQNLRFAPALPGDEEAYRALCKAMAEYAGTK
jgi:anti-sigma factor RsiW